MKGLEQRVKQQMREVSKSNLYAACRRARVQPVIVWNFLKGEKSLTLRVAEKVLNEIDQL